MQKICTKGQGKLVLLSAVAIALVSTAAGVQTYFFRMPDPRTADLKGLSRWLVARELTEESPELRAQILVRLEQHLADGIDLTVIRGQLDAPQLTMFQHNVERLLEDWFLLKSRLYASTPQGERIPLLDRQIDLVQESGVLELALSENSNNVLKTLNTFNAKVVEWIERAAPERREELRQFLSALQGRILLRSLLSNF